VNDGNYCVIVFVDPISKMDKCDTHVFLTGELRFRDSRHFEEFVENTKVCKIYISTWSKFENLAKKISDKYVILEDSHTEPIPTIYQWKHLDLLIKEYCPNFAENDNVFKIRTDCNFTKSIFEEVNSNEYFRMETDQVFSGKATLFKSVLENFYTSIEKCYWNENGMLNTFDLNYENLILSENRNEQENSAFKWHWFVYPKQIFSFKDITFPQFKENIKNNLLLNSTSKRYHGMSQPMMRKMKRIKFSTEKMFLYHLLEHCPVRNYSMPVTLLNRRKSFSFNP
tara:strand:- start:266 stop:1114 length:849 start_codon:yes stop_codon:yes gene_type:complete